MDNPFIQLCAKYCDRLKANLWFFEIGLFLIISGVLSEITDESDLFWNQFYFITSEHNIVEGLFKFTNQNTGPIFVLAGIATIGLSLLERSFKTYTTMLVIGSFAIFNRIFAVLQGEIKSSILIGVAVWVQILILQTRVVSISNSNRKKFEDKNG